MKHYELRATGQYEWIPVKDIAASQVNLGVAQLLDTSICTEVRLTLRTPDTVLHVTYREMLCEVGRRNDFVDCGGDVEVIDGHRFCDVHADAYESEKP